MKNSDECRKCNSTPIDKDANFCHSCGLSRVNYCSIAECKSPNDKHSAFCEKCGNETIYYQENLSISNSDLEKC